MIFIGSKVKTKIPVEMLYTIGLFLDCGIPLLALKYENYKGVLIEANTSDESFIDVEEKHYQTNHAVLGYYISSSWHLPKEICQMILRHHDYGYLLSNVDSEYKIAFAVLKAAKNMVERAKRFNYADLDADFSECF